MSLAPGSHQQSRPQSRSEIDGVLHFLMQAKNEPENVGGVQLSPTVQATRSNYTGVHGGAAVPYLDYFRAADPRTIITDVLQSARTTAG